MDTIKEHNERYEFFHDITGEAMRVYNKYRPGLVESAYEAALKYLLELKGYQVERQVYLPIYWDEVQLEQTYRIDLLVNGNIITELKSVNFIGMEHRKQLWSYMNLTHMPYGMLINFGGEKGLYTEWFKRYPEGGIERIHLL